MHQLYQARRVETHSAGVAKAPALLVFWLLDFVHGWALGLFGELNRPQLYLVTALTWVLMLAWSKPWLDRYRYGPLEWLWRCLTYRQLFALKR